MAHNLVGPTHEKGESSRFKKEVKVANKRVSVGSVKAKGAQPKTGNVKSNLAGQG